MTTTRRRTQAFCDNFGLRVPILQAPMSGACPPELAIAVAEAGGMGASGVLRDSPERIAEWVKRFRAGTSGALQLNIWIPDPPDEDRAAVQRRVDNARSFLGRFGTPPEPPEPGGTEGRGGTGGTGAPVFHEQCEAMLAARPTVISSIMGVFEPEYVRRMHDAGIAWFACATTLDDALTAQEAGADAIVAQGMEAGGHRGSFDPEDAEHTDVGLFSLLPWFADHLRVPIVAAGGIADGRGAAAALALGASAVQVGTALLRCPETGISKDWAASLDGLAPEATTPTRAYSGRLGRAVPTDYVRAWDEPGAPRPAPYPYQLRLVGQWRQGGAEGVDRVSHWAGQSAALATDEPAGEMVARMWRDASTLLA
jgi:nitronate monooxygenase